MCNEEFLITCSMVPLLEAFIPKSVHQNAQIGAPKQHSRSHACFFAKNVVPHACVYLLGHMETNSFAHVTMIGRPREEGQNALSLIEVIFLFLVIISLYLLGFKKVSVLVMHLII